MKAMSIDSQISACGGRRVYICTACGQWFNNYASGRLHIISKNGSWSRRDHRRAGLNIRWV